MNDDPWVRDELALLGDVDTGGAADDDVLTFAAGTWVAAAPSGGGGGGDPVAVDDDGTEVVADVARLNFGDNLTVTDDGDGAVTIDGAAGGGSGGGSTLLDSVTLATAQTAVDLTFTEDVPALRLVALLRSTGAWAVNADDPRIQLGDSGGVDTGATSYSYRLRDIQGNALNSPSGGDDHMALGRLTIPGAGSTAGTYVGFEVTIIGTDQTAIPPSIAVDTIARIDLQRRTWGTAQWDNATGPVRTVRVTMRDGDVAAGSILQLYRG